jgi:hypothetical protein
MLSPVIRNGIARPAEYAAESTSPLRQPPLVAANPMMPPRIGPIHGVQPAANARPSVNEPSIPRGFSLEKKRVSLYNVEIFNRPINWRPNAMMIKPPAILIQRLLRIDAPTRPAVVPNVRKIIERPALKASEFRTTGPVAERVPPSFKRSILTPDINEM